jgi:hypothetical protein
MVGRRSLSAFAAAALLFAGAGAAPAVADEYRALIEVTVPNQATIDSLVAKYDMAEYKREVDGGYIVHAYVNNEERAELKAAGYEIGRTIEDSNTGKIRMEQRQDIIDAETLAKQIAREGLNSKTKFQGQSVIPSPGDTVIQRAHVFTAATGPNSALQDARFLYVEAHNKSTRVTGTSTVTGPTLALSYAGADGVYSTPVNMGRFVDTDPNPDVYMYHRQLIRLTGAAASIPANELTIRIATAATAGGAEASVETSKVTEWLGNELPPHVEGYKNQPFFTHYQDPTETRADLDALAAQYPELMTVVNMPELTSGYQRKAQAIMSGGDPIGSAPAGAGPTLLSLTGEITPEEPVASIPFTATEGQQVRATVDAIPSGSTDFILRLRDPNGTILTTIDTGTSPEFINRTFTTAGTYTFEVLGFQGDVGDFTFMVQTVTGTAAQAQAAAVVLTSHAWGHEGGNNIRAEFRSQSPLPNAPLTVEVNGNLVEVFLATDASGQPSSTAAEVVAALNADAAASALLTATTYRGNAGAGVVRPRARTNLSDFLNAPASVQRGPFQQHLYRIGKHRDGSKVGVFLFCQQHAREWATSLTCQQTAHELVENYATDPYTRELLDNVEVFISPNSNPDGAHYSMYDSNSQRKTMPNYCPTTGNADPAARNTWGVDMNRNSGEYSGFDGYFGASTSCTSETYQGPSEYSEPETRNEKWVTDNFPNVKFSNNIHSYGGYFMWAPGSYRNDGQRTTAPAPNIGIENYFFEAGEKILRRIKEVRNTVILPQRTGPIADVLYSAAGNSADDHWYRKGIIAYSFETGADRFTSTSTGTAVQSVGFQPCFAGVGTGGGTGACPANGSLSNEGRDEALEFAAGNFGLVESAYAYAMDNTPPVTELDSDGVTQSKDPINFRFNWVNEPSVIYYTTDGSTPTLSSTKYENQRARSIGQILTISTPGVNQVKWFAVDIKGNTSEVQTKTFLIDQTGPTITTNIPDGAVYTQGQPVPLTYSCTDDEGGSGIASCEGSSPSGGNLPTDTAGWQTLTITAVDNVGNETVKTVTYRVLDAVNENGNVGGNVGATLSLALGGQPSFGLFTPGVDADYSASTSATIISTAGDAALTVSDPDTVNTGKLVNGPYTLAQPLQTKASSAGGVGGDFAAVGGSASPTLLLSWAAPISNDAATIDFKQTIGRTEGLRTGTYSKTLTFTLSTTNP